MEFVSSLTAKTYLVETENALLPPEPEIGPKDLPKYIPYQPFAGVSHAKENFFFLQCSARGAKLFKHLQAKTPLQIQLFGQTVGSFVGIILQYRAHSFSIESQTRG